MEFLLISNYKSSLAMRLQDNIKASLNKISELKERFRKTSIKCRKLKIFKNFIIRNFDKFKTKIKLILK